MGPGRAWFSLRHAPLNDFDYATFFLRKSIVEEGDGIGSDNNCVHGSSQV